MVQNVHGALSGSYRPYNGTLKAFVGKPAAGKWTLTVTDNGYYFTGQIVNWCLEGVIEDF